MIQDTEPKCDSCGHILPLAGPCANCGTRPKGLHVYIAGSFRDRERVRRCMRAARARGLHVVHDWPAMIESVPGEDRDVPDDEARKHALADIEAIRNAHVLWLLAPPEGQGRGSWVELGIAHQMGRPIVVSGEHARGSIFTALGQRYGTDEAALDALVLARPFVPASVYYGGEGKPGQPDPVPYEDATGDTYPAKGVWQNPERQSGKPCVEGTRIPTTAIAELFVDGKTPIDIVHAFPTLLADANPGKVHDALRYEMGRLLETYEPEGEGGDEGPDDEPDTTVEQHSEWLLSLRGRLAKAEKQIESIDCAIAGAVTRLSGRITEAEEGRRAADAVLDDVLRKLEPLGERVEQGFAAQRAVIKRSTERIDQLERDLAKLRAGGAPESRREHATAAFAYVCGRTRKPMPVPDGEVPLCGEPIPNAHGMACPFPKPCPFHTGEQRGTEAAE